MGDAAPALLAATLASPGANPALALAVTSVALGLALTNPSTSPTVSAAEDARRVSGVFGMVGWLNWVWVQVGALDVINFHFRILLGRNRTKTRL